MVGDWQVTPDETAHKPEEETVNHGAKMMSESAEAAGSDAAEHDGGAGSGTTKGCWPWMSKMSTTNSPLYNDCESDESECDPTVPFEHGDPVGNDYLRAFRVPPPPPGYKAPPLVFKGKLKGAGKGGKAEQKGKEAPAKAGSSSSSASVAGSGAHSAAGGSSMYCAAGSSGSTVGPAAGRSGSTVGPAAGSSGSTVGPAAGSSGSTMGVSAMNPALGNSGSAMGPGLASEEDEEEML